MSLVELVVRNISLFNLFDEVYLFGSVLSESAMPNDIDLLLIYSCSSNDAVSEIKQLRSVLEEKLKLSVDLTVLTLAELEAPDFLERIVNYLKLK